jgi:predicted nucleic acid-binding protein
LKNGKEIGRKGRKNFIPIKLNSSDISEINQNPHESTKEKELELVENLTREIHDRDKKAEDLANKLLSHTSLDVVDSLIVALAISNGLTFWSGDRYILREKVINEIKQVLKKHP